MLSGTRANVAVKIFGPDLQTLRALAEQVQAEMGGAGGVVDLSTEQQTDIPTVRVRFDRPALARYGLSAGEAATAMEVALRGRTVGHILENGLSVPLVLRYPEAASGDLELMGRTLIDTGSAAKVPLAAVAAITEDRGPNFISRENVERKIVVQSNITGRDLRSAVNEIQTRVGAGVSLPPGYRIEYGGQFESEAAASDRLFWLGLAVVAGILFILTAALRSWRDAVIVMANLPLALIGGVAGVYLAGGVLSLAALIGFIALFGIATRNGIMLVTHIKHLMEREDAVNLRVAIIRGSLDRLAPILMTALSTGLALVPVALGAGQPGSEIQAPMAMVIICGLFSATALNMVVVPAAYWVFAKRPVSVDD